MDSSTPEHLATTTRGAVDEATIRGHVAVVDAAGTILGAAGDPNVVNTMRSCVKPLQAIPFVRRALDTVGAPADELAVACASHSGEPVHVRTVRSLLARAGLDEGLLSCGPQAPFDEDAARALIAAGENPRRIHNNCSGKHAAMLVTCAVAGWPVDGYAAYAHPLQAEIRAAMGELAAMDLDAAPRGVDGCGLPTHGLPLSALARMFAAAGADGAFVRCQDAMAAHPHLVAGTGRFDTALLEVAGSALTLKGGGAAVWVAVRRPAGPALAIKLEAGEAAAMPAVALAALRSLGWVDEALLLAPGLAGFASPVLRNWAGEVVGGTRVEAAWLGPLATG